MARVVKMLKGVGALLKKTFSQWNDRDPFSASATIAFYTIFSLPGLLVIIVNVAGYFFGTDAVTSQVSGQIQGMIGQDTATDVQNIIGKASESNGSTLASILGIATLLFGATAVFYQLQQTLNKIWGVKPKPKQKILKLVRDRVFSFGLILVVGFLLLVSLVISASLAALSDWVAGHISEALLVVFKVLDVLISVGIITLLFASMYKFLPDAKIKWRDVWVGAGLTAVLFVIAKFALGVYFGKTDQGSMYGAAGSIILIMLWVSYAGLIWLFGAEFTQVYASSQGEPIQPSEGAVSVDQERKPGDGRTQKQDGTPKRNEGDQHRPRSREKRQEPSPRGKKGSNPRFYFE
jgi:membrane protein